MGGIDEVQPCAPGPVSARAARVFPHPYSEAAEARILWIIIAALTGVAAAGLVLSGLRVLFNPVIVVGFLALVGLNVVYTRIRPNRRIASFALTCAQLVAFTNVGTVLSYLAASAAFPLVDNALAATDSAVGFDWLAFFNWVKLEHPNIGWALDIIYDTLFIQFGVLLVVLNTIGKLERARELAWLFVITLLIILPLSMVLPAEGAWAHYGVSHLTSAYYLSDFYAIRDGSMKIIDLSRINGIIQFPSFHAALALILILTSRGTFLFAVFLPLNILIIVSALTAGGHHLSDVIVGLATVPAAMLVLRGRKLSS